jgi:hypothetical protein
VTVKTYDSQNRLVGEIDTTFLQNGSVVTSNTVCNPNSGQAISQNISVRNSQGKVTTKNTFGGKLLP